ncbi:MAG: hypothetical protein KJO08_03165, partial [Gammaproteobacteria bacterium]|nr:hypothetical protein [Gammaproteobacteria bacterium]
AGVDHVMSVPVRALTLNNRQPLAPRVRNLLLPVALPILAIPQPREKKSNHSRLPLKPRKDKPRKELPLKSRKE